MEEKYSEIQAKYANWQLKAAKETPQTENSGENAPINSPAIMVPEQSFLF